MMDFLNNVVQRVPNGFMVSDGATFTLLCVFLISYLKRFVKGRVHRQS